MKAPQAVMFAIPVNTTSVKSEEGGNTNRFLKIRKKELER